MNVVKSTTELLPTPTGDIGLVVNTHTHRKWRAVAARLVVAGLLLTAAGLKAHALLVHPLSPGSPLLSRPMEYLAVGFEMALGLWLLSGWQAPLAWLTALVTFTTFAGASAWLALQGHSSCGCFGAVPVSPWQSFGIDVVALTLLLIGWPSRASWQHSCLLSFWRRAGWASAVLAVMLVGGWFTLSALGHDPALLLAEWRGDTVVADPVQTNVGEGPAGTAQTFLVTLHNRGRQPVRIVGGTTDCGCLATSDLPVSISPGGSVALRVHFKRSGQPGVFKRGFWLYTDAARQPFVVAWFAGRIVAP